MTLAPGLHDLSTEFYNSDPCPSPSLTSTGIRTLLEASPAHFAARHSRLSAWPDQLAQLRHDRDESLGTVVRHIVLGSEHEIAALPFEDWTGKLAQLQRKRARADGQIPVTEPVYAHASEIARTALVHLAEPMRAAGTVRANWPTLAWERQAASRTIWCRERVDQLRTGAALLVQTVTRAASTADIARAAEHNGLDLKAAWALDGLRAVARDRDRPAHVLIVTVELEPPYSATALPLSAEWLAETGERIERAAGLFATCLAARQWRSRMDHAGSLNRPPRRTI